MTIIYLINQSTSQLFNEVCTNALGEKGTRKMPLQFRRSRCTGCKLCQLACSATHEMVFNPEKSRIKIDHVYREDGIHIASKHCTFCKEWVNLYAGQKGLGTRILISSECLMSWPASAAGRINCRQDCTKSS